MNKKITNIASLTKIAILASISVLLMFIKFPLPFAPSFMEVDISELPALIGGFALGPIAGLLIVLLKIVLYTILHGSKTFYVGELSNLIVSSTFVLITSYIYSKGKSKKSAVFGLIIGGLMMSLIAVLSNYFVIFPLYAKMMKVDLNIFVKMAEKINPLVHGYLSMMIFAVLPFNIVKATITSIITFLLYKKISKILKD